MVRKNIFKVVTVLLLLGTVHMFSPKADGLPGEFLITQRWRDLFVEHSPLANPAFLTEANYIGCRLAFAPVLGDAFKLWETGVTFPIGLYQSVGGSAFIQDEGKIGQGTYGTDGRITALDDSTYGGSYFFMLSYAIQIWNRLSIGVNGNFAYQALFGESRTGVGLDFGVTWRLLRHPILGDHLLGVSTINFLPPAMEETFTLTFAGEGAYSRDLKLSLHSKYWGSQITSGIDVDIKDFIVSAEEFKSENGLDAAKKLEYSISSRLGVWLLQMLKLYGQFGFDKDGFDYFGFAGGVNFPTANNGRDLEALYQYNIMNEGEATTHTLYFRADIGKHREEIYARKMARLASLSPNELYNRARRLYSEGKYWDAFFVFSRIVVEYPDFFKNDWVSYYRASCQELLDMRAMSMKNYEQTKDQYSRSTVVPYADLGKMRIHYRNGEDGMVASQFAEMNKPNVPDSLRYHATYLMGETHLRNNDFRKAIQVLSMVPEEHPDYVFAQHSIAVAHANLDDGMQSIVSALENCISVKVTTEKQKEIVNRSYVFLGYIFYEENTLSKAIVALRMVPTESYYAEDALLGQGWTALKARQWNDCIAVGQLLSKTSNKTILQCEGMLIQAYGHLLKKEYGQSLAILKSASAKIRPLSEPGYDTLNYERMQYENTRLSYQFLAEKIDNLSRVGQSATMLEQTDSLHQEQMGYVKKIDDYLNFADSFERVAFFARNIHMVRDDIEYALATVQKIIGRSGINKEQEKIEDKQKNIDDQIEKLKKEMEKLQEKQ